MTEAEWLACEDPESMIENGLFDRGDRLKLIRFSLICASLHLPWMTDERSRRAVEIAERFVTSQATSDELDRARADAREATERVSDGSVNARVRRPAAVTAEQAVTAASLVRADSDDWGVIQIVEVMALSVARSLLHVTALVAETPDAVIMRRAYICSLLRCIFGNPFRPVALDSAWRTSDVRLLAQGIYEEKAFDRMPILADALQDAGCTNEDVLNHCRDPKQVHVRGCWVLDLLLCKG